MTQRTAHMDLVWEKEDTGDYYAAALPDIPGYPNPKGGPYHAVVSEDTVTTSGGWLLYIALRPGVDLYEQDFGIQPTETAEEMMQAVDNLSVEDIVDALEANGKEPWGNDDTVAARHASKRTASMDVDWWKTSADTWAGTLPEIPGFPKPGGGRCTVGLNTMVNDDHEPIGYGFDMNIFAPNGVRTLWEDDFGFGYADTEEEAMQEVESLSPEMIAQAAEDAGLEPVDNVSASRKGKYMMRKATRRTASMDLDWVNPSEDVYQADLPAIPGYTEPDGNESFVTVTYDNDGGVEAVATIFPTQGGVVNLDCWSILGFIPEDETLEDVMQAFDDLDVYDFSYALDKEGIEPMVDENDEYLVASRKPRHATRRKADMSLDWVRMGDDYGATLPAIPGYQGSYPDEVRVASRPKDDDVWLFEMLIGVGDKQVPLYNYDFGIPYGGSADEMMDAVENLNPQDIASVLEDFGFAPEED